jgi:hypothetical protein
MFTAIPIIGYALNDVAGRLPINTDTKHRIFRTTLTGVITVFSWYGAYLQYVKRDAKFLEAHPYSDIEYFMPIPSILDQESAYYIRGTHIMMVIDDGAKHFLKISYDADSDYLETVTLEQLLSELPEEVGEVIVFNIDRLS